MKVMGLWKITPVKNWYAIWLNWSELCIFQLHYLSIFLLFAQFILNMKLFGQKDKPTCLDYSQHLKTKPTKKPLNLKYMFQKLTMIKTKYTVHLFDRLYISKITSHIFYGVT